MKRLLIALTIVMMTAGSAFAHGRVSFGINLTWPFFYPYTYPVYSYPATYGYYTPPMRVYVHEPAGAKRVVERVYINGYLVEERVKVYDDRYDYDTAYRHYGYGR